MKPGQLLELYLPEGAVHLVPRSPAPSAPGGSPWVKFLHLLPAPRHRGGSAPGGF